MDRNPRTPYPLSQKDEPFPPGAPRERRVGLSTLSAPPTCFFSSFENNLRNEVWGVRPARGMRPHQLAY